jgi:DNA polymerase I-like protein with 3'-5' exonuclease and polymerase domains
MKDIKQMIAQAEKDIEDVLSELEEHGIQIYKLQLLQGGGINLVLDERTGHTR